VTAPFSDSKQIKYSAVYHIGALPSWQLEIGLGWRILLVLPGTSGVLKIHKVNKNFKCYDKIFFNGFLLQSSLLQLLLPGIWF
jgi:hypothetical protein